MPQQSKHGVVEDGANAGENRIKVLSTRPNKVGPDGCANGGDANGLLPQFEVVSVEIDLPGVTGIKCTLIKQLIPKTLVLMMTASLTSDYTLESSQPAASGYRLERNSFEKAVRSILDVMEGGSPMTGQIAQYVMEVFRKPEPREVTKAALTAREGEILKWISKGLSNKEIASQVNTTVYTVRKHVEHIYEKLKVHCRTEAAAKYLSIT